MDRARVDTSKLAVPWRRLRLLSSSSQSLCFPSQARARWRGVAPTHPDKSCSSAWPVLAACSRGSRPPSKGWTVLPRQAEPLKCYFPPKNDVFGAFSARPRTDAGFKWPAGPASGSDCGDRRPRRPFPCPRPARCGPPALAQPGTGPGSGARAGYQGPPSHATMTAALAYSVELGPGSGA